jgi:Tfp pilus assembly protein PilO
MAFDWRTEYHRYHRYFLNTQTLYRRRDVMVYTGIILTLVTITFFSFFAIKPTVTTIAGLAKEIDSKRVIDQKLQNKINSLRQAQTNYSQVSDKLVLIDQVLPRDPDLIDLIYQIEVLAQKNNVTIKSVSFGPSYLLGQEKTKKKLSQYPAINFSLGLSGDFESVDNFTSSLQNLRRSIGTQDLTIRSLEESETGTFSLNLTLQLDAFYLTGDTEK